MLHAAFERFVKTHAPRIVPAAPWEPFSRTLSWLCVQALAALPRNAAIATGIAPARSSATMLPTTTVRCRLIAYLLVRRSPTLCLRLPRPASPDWRSAERPSWFSAIGDRSPFDLGATLGLEALQVDVGVVDVSHRSGDRAMAGVLADQPVHLVRDAAVRG